MLAKILQSLFLLVALWLGIKLTSSRFVWEALLLFGAVLFLYPYYAKRQEQKSSKGETGSGQPFDSELNCKPLELPNRKKKNRNSVIYPPSIEDLSTTVKVERNNNGEMNRSENHKQEPNFLGEPHEILAIPKHASKRTIMRAYRKLVKQFHPDYCKDSDAAHKTMLLAKARDQLIGHKKAG